MTRRSQDAAASRNLVFNFQLNSVHKSFSSARDNLDTDEALDADGVGEESNRGGLIRLQKNRNYDYLVILGTL